MDQEVLTKDSFLDFMQAFEERLDGRQSRFISRSEIIREIGRTLYDEGVRRAYLIPIKGKGKNSKIRIDRREYRAYLEQLKK